MDPRNVKILFVSRDLAKEGTGGSGTYRLDFLKYLKMLGFEIEYLLLNHAKAPDEDWTTTPSYIREIAIVSAIDAKDVAPVWNGIPTEKEVTFFQKRFLCFQPDVVIADRVWLGGLFDYLPSGKTALIAILTHQVNSQREETFRKAGLAAFKRAAGLPQPKWDMALESKYLRKAQILLAIQREDYLTFQQMAPGVEVIHLPMAATLHPCQYDKQILGRCLFAGGSGTNSNIDGLRFFLNQMWPMIIAQLPHASLHICGNVCDDIRSLFPDDYPNTTLMGRVPKLDQEYAMAEVCLIPLRIGSGLKIKLVEALSYGRAGVSTSVGLQGITEVSGKGILLADSADEFSSAVIKLITDPLFRRIQELQGRRFAAQFLAPDVAYGPFVYRIYQHISGECWIESSSGSQDS